MTRCRRSRCSAARPKRCTAPFSRSAMPVTKSSSSSRITIRIEREWLWPGPFRGSFRCGRPNFDGIRKSSRPLSLPELAWSCSIRRTILPGGFSLGRSSKSSPRFVKSTAFSVWPTRCTTGSCMTGTTCPSPRSRECESAPSRSIPPARRFR